MISRRTISRLLAGLLGSAMVLSAAAQGFPNKMVTVMVPYPAGGPSDAVARLVQVEYEKHLGQKMMVENLGGVSGALGVQKVLAAPAAGYYQLLSTPMELVMAPLALSAVKFKPEEVRMTSLMGRTSIGLAVRKDLPVNSVDDLARDPALLERPMLQDVLTKHGIPHTAFKYAENTGQMAPIREQAGTFADSIKLWNAA